MCFCQALVDSFRNVVPGGLSGAFLGVRTLGPFCPTVFDCQMGSEAYTSPAAGLGAGQ